jgi:mycothiol synthase
VENDNAIPIGFSRVRWYTGAENTRLFYQDSYLLPEWRMQGIWNWMIKENDRRLAEIADQLQPAPSQFLQAWATATQKVLISMLEEEGYLVVRRFANMLNHLDDIPTRELPAGLEIRPVQAEQYRSIWEARRELEGEVFETIAEKWTDDKYQSWLNEPSHTPHLWQIAWDGNQLAGMVLNRVSVEENERNQPKRGHTEHIYVRKGWRNRGLAGALIAQSLRLLKEQGMDEAELGVDMNNESRAYELYKKMGYETYSTDIWFRKPMEYTGAEQQPEPVGEVMKGQ